MDLWIKMHTHVHKKYLLEISSGVIEYHSLHATVQVDLLQYYGWSWGFAYKNRPLQGYMKALALAQFFTSKLHKFSQQNDTGYIFMSVVFSTLNLERVYCVQAKKVGDIWMK